MALGAHLFEPALILARLSCLAAMSALHLNHSALINLHLDITCITLGLKAKTVWEGDSLGVQLDALWNLD